MNAYMILFDSVNYLVEASSVANAVEAWKEHVKAAWESDYDGTEESESIHRIHDEPVIRGK